MQKQSCGLSYMDCYAYFEVVYTIVLVIKPSENCCVAENHQS